MFGAETIRGGVCQVIPGKRKQVTLNRFYSAVQKITARVATPTTAADALTKDERQITMAEIMWYDEFDPKDFNLDWQFLNTVGASVDARAARVLLNAIRSSVVNAFNYDLEQLIWNGDTDSSDAWLAPIDGFVKLIDADTTVNSVTPAGAISAANVIAVLEAVVQACPNEVKELGSPTIVTNHTVKHLYREAARALDYKGTNITQAIADVYGGYPIVSVNGVPANRVFMMNAGGGDMAELKMATWANSDNFTVKIERLQANSDLFFIKINSEIGVNHVYGKQITEYSPA
jgi:hypothetical protein